MTEKSLGKFDFDIPGKFMSRNEGHIYRVEKVGRAEAWKIYPHLELSTIRHYQHLTDLVLNHISGRAEILSSLDGSVKFPFTWKVVPIDLVSVSHGHPLTQSEWVEGDSIQDLIDRQLQSGEEEHPIQKIEALDFDSIYGSLKQFSQSLIKN